MRRLLIASVAVVLCALAAGPSVAHTATPCWQRVINDWTKDGQINGHYSPHCLRQAIKNTPEDLRDYSSIIDDINAALLDTLGAKNGPNGGSGSGPAGSIAGPGGKLSAKEAQKRAQEAVPHAGTSESIPNSSRTIPLPLLIIAGIAIAALLAAASPPLIQRLRARFPRGRAAPQADRT